LVALFGRRHRLGRLRWCGRAHHGVVQAFVREKDLGVQQEVPHAGP